MSLAALIRLEKEQVLEEWEGIVRSLTSARRLSRPALRDHLPDFLDWLAGRVEASPVGGAFPHEHSTRHAVERLAEGYDLSEILSEYIVLRDCLLEAWERSGAQRVRPGEIRRMNQAIDDAIAFTAVVYARSVFKAGRDASAPPR
jgi:hypothetical protein